VYNKKVLDVAGGRDEEGNNVQIYKPNGTSAQKWKLTYVKDAKAISTKGLNKNFGLEVNRPFFIQSKMWMGRVLTCHSAYHMRLNTLLRTRLAQQWVFDGKSKTIMNKQWMNRSLQAQTNKSVIL
jgi:hypothetical protein